MSPAKRCPNLQNQVVFVDSQFVKFSPNASASALRISSGLRLACASEKNLLSRSSLESYKSCFIFGQIPRN